MILFFVCAFKVQKTTHKCHKHYFASVIDHNHLVDTIS